MAESVVTRLYLVYDRLREAGMVATVQRSDFVTRLAAPLLLAMWPSTAGSAPRARVRLSGSEASTLDTITGPAFDEVLRRAASCCSRTMSTVGRLLAESGSPDPPGGFSERISIWVRQQFIAHQPPISARCDEFAARMVAEASPGRPLVREAFAKAYSHAYDVAWARSGVSNLSRHPVSAVALGSDQRPPLVTTSPGTHRDWSQGTNRAVFERYRLRYKRSAQVQPTRCDGPLCRARVVMLVEEPGLAEVVRACQVYGLAQPAHQQVIRALVHGLEVLTADHGWMTWEEWVDPCRPIELEGEIDTELADAVASALAAWASGPVGRPLIQEFGFESLSGPLQRVVARKAWMSLLGHERTYTDPMHRCGIPRLVRTALYRHVPVAVRQWIDGSIGDPDQAPTPGGGVVRPAVRLRVEQHRATLRLLTAHPEVVQLMVVGDVANWRPAYDDLRRLQPDVAYLETDDAFAAVRDLLEGMS